MNPKLRTILFLMLLFTVVSGCHLFNKPPDDPEGEGEPPIEGEAPVEGEVPVEGETPVEGEAPVEGETPIEGEIPIEGETPIEGEIPIEGEPLEEGEPLFTSADVGGFYNDRDEEIDAEPPTEDEGGDDERALVEPDVIHRAGALLYILNQYRGLSIVDLDTETLLSQTPTHGYPRDLYLVGDYAYVLVSYAQEIEWSEGLLSVSYGSRIYVFNIADPVNVYPAGVFAIDGDLVDSRMVGDVIYAVCSDYTWYDCCEDTDGVVRPDAASKWYGQTWAVSLNIADPSDIRIVDTLAIPGYGNLIQATNYAIFSVSQDYNTGDSVITYIDIADPSGVIVARGTTKAPGYMADRFKMNAWNGALRVVTNTWWPRRETYITTYDLGDPDTLVPLGQTHLENATGETAFATRFDGPLAYIVTYLQVDPLFVVDLSDPTAPRVRGELKIPGWSTHIEPFGDRLIALGVDDEDGGRRVGVSLFDVSDPDNPQRIAYVRFGDSWTWSAAYGDVKAFTVLEDVILVPFSGWNHGYGGYDRLQFVAHTRDDLELMGYVDLQGSAVRSFAYEGLYYAVTQEQLAVIDVSDLAAPEVLRSVTLAENVVDVAPLPNGWTVEVVVRNDTGDTLLRAENRTAGVSGGAVLVAAPTVTETFVLDNAVVVVSSVYDYEPTWRGYYRAFLVDFSNPVAPEVAGAWEIDLEPWWGGWWYDGPEIDGPGGREKRMPYYWGGYGGAAAYLAGEYLALRGYRERYETVLGGETPWQGMALINLSSASEPVYIGLGFENLTSMDAVGDTLYLTTRRQVGLDEQQRAICAYYLQFLNPATLELSAAVNVPGVFLHQLPNTQRLVFRDTQYTEDRQTITLLRSTLFSDGRVTLVDSAKLPPGYWTLMTDGVELYYSGYYYGENTPGDEPDWEDGLDIEPRDFGKQVEPSSYIVGALSVSRSGTFIAGETVSISRSWCDLLGVRDGKAYLRVAWAGVAQCDFRQSPPTITDIAPVMGYPDKIRFSASEAFIPLGYSGLLVMSQ